MKGTNELSMAIRAGYSLFYVQTQEMNRSVAAIRETIEGMKDKTSVTGFKIWDLEKDNDPLILPTWLDDSPTGTVVLAKNYNWFLVDDYGNPNKNVVQFLQNRLELFCSVDGRKVLIIAGDAQFDKAIPATLQKDFMQVAFSLPTEEEIAEVLGKIIKCEKTNPKFKVPSEQQTKELIDSAKGMSKQEIENAYSYSLVQHKGELQRKTIAGIRARDIENTAGLTISDSELKFDSLLGYDNMKIFTLDTIHSELAKGIMLIGPPGTGKTHFCRCLGNEANIPAFEMEMANLFGSLQGETEKQVKRALDVVAANAPCILFIDELEKALAGVGGSGNTDGGTAKRALAQLLKFLSNRPKSVYVVATCNDISALPPEWVRPGRWDSAPFFVDLPTDNEKKEILKFYQKKYNVNSEPNMEGWTGAEIEACCRIAAMMNTDTQQAQRFIVPISKTMETEIAALRKWSEGRTVPASAFELVKEATPKSKKAIDY